jgi:hypothetical protein
VGDLAVLRRFERCPSLKDPVERLVHRHVRVLAFLPVVFGSFSLNQFLKLNGRQRAVTIGV